MGVSFYEQVPHYRWDITTAKRLRNLILKLRWTQQEFVDYLYSTVLAKVECDILGWNNYRGFRIPTSCPSCNEFDAENELLPIYLVFIKNLESSYSSKFRGFSQIVEHALIEVASSIFASISQENDSVVRSSKLARWTEQRVLGFLKERMAVYHKFTQSKSIRAIPETSFTPIKDTLVRLHGCYHLECGRFQFVDYYTVRSYYDYLEDGFSFIKLV